MLQLSLPLRCAAALLSFGAATCRPSSDGGQTPFMLAAGTAKKPAGAGARPYVAPRVPLGVNLSAVNYYATAIPFVDVMKMADPFQSTNAPDSGGGDVWDTEVADKIARDEDGYPLEIPVNVPGKSAPQILRTSVVVPIYGGRYTVLYDGDGELAFPASALQVVNRAPGRIDLEVQAQTSPDQPIFLAIVRSSRANHIRNIRMLLPGYEASYAKQVFHPTFLAKLNGVGALRFMDWGGTNGSPLQHWSERPRPSAPQGGPRGVALETMIDLANRLDTDAWFCVPHRADDEYITEMAKLIKARLDPKHHAYIEYSNELWNGIFTQAKWASEQGCRAGLNKQGRYEGSCDDDGARFWAGIKWNARRSGQIFATFDKVFAGEPQRVVRVLAGQAQNDDVNDVLLTSFEDARINPARGGADVLAIAPYVGGGLATELVEHGKAASVTVPELLDRLEKLIGPEVSEPTAHNKKLADRHGLHLVAYEGGQHLIAYGDAQDDRAFVNKLIAANRDPRMRSIYMHMLDAWYAQSGNGLFMAFNFAETPSKYGMWGLLESQEQPMSAAPKYQAFFDRLQRLSSRAAPPPSAATPK